jgi:hypothetical protein
MVRPLPKPIFGLSVRTWVLVAIALQIVQFEALRSQSSAGTGFTLWLCTCFANAMAVWAVGELTDSPRWNRWVLTLVFVVPFIPMLWLIFALFKSSQLLSKREIKPNPSPLATAVKAHLADAASQAIAQEAPRWETDLNADIDAMSRDRLAFLFDAKAARTPIAFEGQLKELHLDWSVDSLDRVEALLKKLRHTGYANSDVSTWKQQIKFYEFLLCLAFYIGGVVARHGQTPLQWSSRLQENQHRTQPSECLPDEFWASIVGNMRVGTCVPLGILENILTGESPFSLKAYATRLFEKELYQTNENARAEQLIAAFGDGTEPLGGLDYRSELKAVILDGTIDSFDRIDAMLKELVKKHNLNVETMLRFSSSQNFCRFLGVYLGRVTAQYCNADVKWLNYHAFSQHMNAQAPAYGFEFSAVALIGGAYFMPLAWVIEAMFNPNRERDLRQSAEFAKARALAGALEEKLVLTLAMLEEPTPPLPPLWAEAAYQSGYAASFAMFGVVDGGNPAPTITPSLDAQGQRTLVSFGMLGNDPESLVSAKESLRNNIKKYQYQILTYDDDVTLKRGRRDAILVECRIYISENTGGSEPIAFNLVCPYHHAQSGSGFAIECPSVLACTVPEAYHRAMAMEFYKGAMAFKITQPGANFSWVQHLNENA